MSDSRSRAANARLAIVRRAHSGLVRGRLDVLLDTAGEHDHDLARDLARTGHGRLLPVRHHREIAPALSWARAS